MKRLMMKYMAVAVFLVAAVLGSFSIPRRELRSTGQVAGIALDEVEGKLRATFELYAPSLDEPIGKRRATVVTLGESLQECMDRAQLSGGESLFADDISALILSGAEDQFLLQKVYEHYRLLKNDQMDLPVFFTFGQDAGRVFEGEGAVLSGELAESAKAMHKLQTIRDLVNGSGERVLIRGEGCYEIIS